MSAREFLQRNYDNEVKLRQFAEVIWPFFKKMFIYQNATYSEMSIQEIIDNDRYLIELNGPERFFTFTYGEYGT